MHTLKVYQRFRRLTQISDGNLWNCSIALLLSCSVFMWATSSLKALPFTALHCVLFLSGFHQDRNTEFFFAERRRRWMSKLFGGTIIMFQVGKGMIQNWIISKRHYQQKKKVSLSQLCRRCKVQPPILISRRLFCLPQGTNYGRLRHSMGCALCNSRLQNSSNFE